MCSTVRTDLRLIYDRAVNAVKPDVLIKSFIQIDEMKLFVKNLSTNLDKQFDLNNRDIYILGAGKAVLKMCEELLSQVDSYNNNNKTTNGKKVVIKRGLLSVPIGSQSDSPLFDKYNVRYQTGALNNMPDRSSERTTQQIIDLIRSAKSDMRNTGTNNNTKSLILSFISGGGSALLSLPKQGVSLNDKYDLIKKLVKCGANIQQLNTVRRCLSQVKCGKLAHLVTSEPNSMEMVCFIISDIIGDPIELIASGSTVVLTGDSEKTSTKALKILNEFHLKINDNLRDAILSEDNYLQMSYDWNLLHNLIVGNNTIAVNVAKQTAKQLGYKVIDLGNEINGEAKVISDKWFEMANNYQISDDDRRDYKGICWLAGGETTVNMTESNSGLGGRCQEMGLAFANRSYKCDSGGKMYFLCAGTDGQDGPTDVAGVIAESGLKSMDPSGQLAKQLDIDLKNHNSYEFFNKFFSNWFIKTGISGTNVMDIYCLIKNLR
ncbi:uncharacterized protein C13B9.2-like [Oppia nitens]|uniref:uncharacterized protein C13B9.2-like n=1 Tax=Oppia nitens TaxID=1686743 RepID=UPI0023D9DC3D|nr:uncharacterized protein C13B9.2-like [Oppia nitens]